MLLVALPLDFELPEGAVASESAVSIGSACATERSDRDAPKLLADDEGVTGIDLFKIQFLLVYDPDSLSGGRHMWNFLCLCTKVNAVAAAWF